ncbi:MAG: hypothetical protein RMM30_01380 [Armatimonadota bacterium]|nr:hypothetical protein [Armatimonadota bacterium]MDW8155226.1 hypothetical protein [Armatimonadota bacterium]
MRRVREAWRAFVPTRTLRFLRADHQDPAAVLLTFGSFSSPRDLRRTLELVCSDRARAARATLCDLFAACRKPHPEFQFRYDLQGTMVRGRFVPTDAGEVDAAVQGLAELAAELERAGLPPGATVVVASYRERWLAEGAHGFDPTAGTTVVYRYRARCWQREGGQRP